MCLEIKIHTILAQRYVYFFFLGNLKQIKLLWVLVVLPFFMLMPCILCLKNLCNQKTVSRIHLLLTILVFSLKQADYQMTKESYYNCVYSCPSKKSPPQVCIRERHGRWCIIVSNLTGSGSNLS